MIEKINPPGTNLYYQSEYYLKLIASFNSYKITSNSFF